MGQGTFVGRRVDSWARDGFRATGDICGVQQIVHKHLPGC